MCVCWRQQRGSSSLCWVWTRQQTDSRRALRETRSSSAVELQSVTLRFITSVWLTFNAKSQPQVFRLLLPTCPRNCGGFTGAFILKGSTMCHSVAATKDYFHIYFQITVTRTIAWRDPNQHFCLCKLWKMNFLTHHNLKSPSRVFPDKMDEHYEFSFETPVLSQSYMWTLWSLLKTIKLNLMVEETNVKTSKYF